MDLYQARPVPSNKELDAANLLLRRLKRLLFIWLFGLLCATLWFCLASAC